MSVLSAGKKEKKKESQWNSRVLVHLDINGFILLKLLNGEIIWGRAVKKDHHPKQ